MGKSTKPLVIVALPPCNQWEELDKLESQGHTVIRLEKIENGFRANIEDLSDIISLILDADITLGANCWRLDTQHRPYLALAIKEARMLRYQQNEDKADIKKRHDADRDIGLSGDTKELRR